VKLAAGQAVLWKGRSMGMRSLNTCFLKLLVWSRSLTRHLNLQTFGDRICVLASRGPGGAVHRLDKLYSCEDARLVASELNREWLGSSYWAAPATADETKAHAAQAARLMRSIAR
jgi:hypothetical protein